ncbi:MAG: type III-A CRISPR-associated RAMP protein Csm3 [Bacteroidota bacterium]
MTTNLKLIKKIKIKGNIECLSGMRIGGSVSSLSIGGVDSIIIRNPKDNKPYIPGSSLKGKLRYLTEISNGTISDSEKSHPIKYGPSDNPEHIAVKLFGASTDKKDALKLPSRVIVRDGHILNEEADFQNAIVPFAELKTEVVIDRITSKANPRTIERVPAGAKFSMEILLNIFNFKIENNQVKELDAQKIQEEETTLLSELLKSLYLLQNDYLGGNGSRGYGNVQIHIEELQQISFEQSHIVSQPYSNSNRDIQDLLEKLNYHPENTV